MKRKLVKNKKIVLLRTELDVVANIYGALLVNLESIVYELEMKEIYQRFRERGIKFTKSVASLEDQIKTVDRYYDSLILLDNKITKLKHIELRSVSGIEENRDRVLNAFRTLSNFTNIAKDESERRNLNNFMSKTKTTINLVLFILRHNEDFSKDQAFKNIEDSEIVPETKDENIL